MGQYFTARHYANRPRRTDLYKHFHWHRERIFSATAELLV